MSADTPLDVVRCGRVAHIRMARARRMNTVDEALADALQTAFATVAADPGVRAVVLSGEGRSFMAGGDLTRFRADLDAAPATAARLIGGVHATIRTIAEMPQPVVAAVQGPVAGGGVGIALACDLVVAAEDATFLSAYARLGTSPDDGTTWTLTRLLGAKRALAFMLLNEPLTAAEAMQLGLVNAVTPPEELEGAALAMADRIAAGASGATASLKRLVRAASTRSLEAQLDAEMEGFVGAARTADFREGVTAFFERRAPSFGT